MASHVRLDPPGTDGVDGDVRVAQRGCELAGHAVECRLRDAVGGGPSAHVGKLTGSARHVDDPAGLALP